MPIVECNLEECKYNKNSLCKKKEIRLESTLSGDETELCCKSYDETGV
jgi:hypothetical protein